MSQLHDLTALEQGAAIRSGDVSSTELTQHYLERSQRLSDSVGAFVLITEDLALEQAQAADRLVQEHGTDGLPPLFGVVCPVKDLSIIANVPTRFGSAVADITLPEDDHVVARMRADGLVFTGKTNTPEFGLPCYTEPEVAPAARTPWDLDRSAGGSSGGSAAAVAAGLAPIVHGSDGGGSIRIPSAVTGLVGIKPSRGRAGVGPIGELIGELATNGPIARNVADAAALLDVMAYTPAESSVPGPRQGSFVDAARREPGQARIGFYRSAPLTQSSIHPDVATALDNTASALEALGHSVEEIEVPFGEYLLPDFMTLWTALAMTAPIPPEREAELRPLTRYLRDLGRQVTDEKLEASWATLRASARAAIEATEQLDAVLVPTLARPPARVGELRDDDDPAKDFQDQGEYSPFCAVYNVTGQPSINVPMNWNADGLPIGVQLVGRMYEEETIISLAAQLEATHSWLDRTPAMW